MSNQDFQYGVVQYNKNFYAIDTYRLFEIAQINSTHGRNAGSNIFYDSSISVVDISRDKKKALTLFNEMGDKWNLQLVKQVGSYDNNGTPFVYL